MKLSNVLLVLLLLLPAILLDAQQAFIKTYGGEEPECAHGVGAGPDGRIAIAARSSAAGNGDAEGIFINLSRDGEILQSRRLAGSEDFFLSGVFPDFTGGGSTLIGSVRTSRGDFDGVILRLRASGTTRWQKSIGTTRDDLFKSFTVTGEAAYVVFGDSVTANGARDFFVVKYNKRGRVRWKKTFGTPGDDIAFHISHTSDNGFIVSGASHESDQNSPSRAVVAKLDASGNIQWSKRYGSVAQINNGEFVIQSSDLGFYLIQFSANNRDQKGKTLIAKLDANGSPVFARLFRSGTATLHMNQGFIGTDGGLIFSGLVSKGSVSRGVIVKLDAAGSILWKKAAKASNRSGALTGGVLEDADGAFLAAGCFGINPDDDPKETVLVKLTASGNTGGSCSSLANVRISSSNFNLETEAIGLTVSEPAYQTGNPRLNNTAATIESNNICS